MNFIAKAWVNYPGAFGVLNKKIRGIGIWIPPLLAAGWFII